MPFLLRCSTRLLFAILLFSPITTSASSLAELVWIENQQNTNYIRFGFYDGNEWSIEDKFLYESSNPITSLALGTDQYGSKTLVWSEQIRSKTVLMIMNAKSDNDKSNQLNWSAASLFIDEGRENFSSSILFDQNGKGWLFWSETKANFSDVMLRRFDGYSWQQAERVHPENNVPDNLPRAKIDHEGNIKVEWNSYDFQKGDYVQKTRVYPTTTVDKEEPNDLLDSVGRADIPIPREISPQVSALLHFPGNKMIQSEALVRASQ